MALTGVSGEQYQRSPHLGGPAFLVYYSPAFLRQSSRDSKGARLALAQLAATYRTARSLFPFNPKDTGKSVTVRIDQLKAVGDAATVCTSYCDGSMWILVRKSLQEAIVEQHSQRDLFVRLSAPFPSYSVHDMAPLALWEEALSSKPEDLSRRTGDTSQRTVTAQKEQEEIVPKLPEHRSSTVNPFTTIQSGVSLISAAVPRLSSSDRFSAAATQS